MNGLAAAFCGGIALSLTAFSPAAAQITGPQKITFDNPLVEQNDSLVEQVRWRGGGFRGGWGGFRGPRFGGPGPVIGGWGGRPYYGYGGWGRRGWGGGGWGWGGAAAGLATGAIIGGIIANENSGFGYGNSYVVEGGGGGYSSYCARRYRSYDPASGTYLGYDGLRHPCP